MSNNVWKLLRRNISVSQIVGYAIANLVGLSIIIAAVQFYGDTSEAISGEDSFLSKDYVIISKKVSALNTVGAGGDWGVFLARGFQTDDPKSHKSANLFGGYAHNPLTYGKAVFAKDGR